MHSLSTIRKQNNRAVAEAIAASIPSSSFVNRPNGDVLVAWHPTGQRRRSVTISGEQAATFRSNVRQVTTKTGKVPQRSLDRLIYDLVAPAPKFEVLTVADGKQVAITKRRDHDILGRKTLGPRKSAAFLKERAGITVNPTRAPRKYEAAVSALAATYF